MSSKEHSKAQLSVQLLLFSSDIPRPKSSNQAITQSLLAFSVLWPPFSLPHTGMVVGSSPLQPGLDKSPWLMSILSPFISPLGLVKVALYCRWVFMSTSFLAVDKSNLHCATLWIHPRDSFHFPRGDKSVIFRKWVTPCVSITCSPDCWVWGVLRRLFHVWIRK